MDYIKNFEKAVENFQAESNKVKSINSLISNVQSLLDAVKRQNGNMQSAIDDIEKYDNSATCLRKNLEILQQQIKTTAVDNSKALNSATRNLEKAAALLVEKAVQESCVNEIKECLVRLQELSASVSSQVGKFNGIVAADKKERAQELANEVQKISDIISEDKKDRCKTVGEQVRQFNEILSQDKNDRDNVVRLIKEDNQDLCNRIHESVEAIVRELSDSVSKDVDNIHKIFLDVGKQVKELQNTVVEDKSDRNNIVKLIKEENQNVCDKTRESVEAVIKNLSDSLYKDISEVHELFSGIDTHVKEFQGTIAEDKNDRHKMVEGQLEEFRAVLSEDQSERVKCIDLIKKETHHLCNSLLETTEISVQKISDGLYKEVNSIHTDINDVEKIIYEDKSNRAEFLAQVQSAVNKVYEQDHKTADNLNVINKNVVKASSAVNEKVSSLKFWLVASCLMNLLVVGLVGFLFFRL